MEVTLSWFEVFQAVQAGGMRQIEALKHERPHRYGDPPQDDWGVHIEAAGAEMAVAKAFDVYWERVARRPETLRGDVGNLQIRSTWREKGRLILHDRDPDDAVFVLVTGRMPVFNVRGWILGGDGKVQEHWDDGDGRAAYFVPQEALQSGKPPLGRVTVGPWPGSGSNTTGTSSE